MNETRDNEMRTNGYNRTGTIRESTPVGKTGDSVRISTIGRERDSCGRALLGASREDAPLRQVGDSWMVSSIGRVMDS
jgi:hypothetical protein